MHFEEVTMLALPRSGQRIDYSTFAKRVDVKRDRSAFARYCPAHSGEGVVVIQIFERGDATAYELVFRHGLAPLSHLFIDPDKHVRRERVSVFPVVGVKDPAHTPVGWMLGDNSFEGCEKHCVLRDQARVAVI